MRPLVAAAAVFAALTATAAADATIIKGGPRGDDAGVAEALAAANAAMSVCGRGAVGSDAWSADVKVEVRIDGSVKATASGFSKVAQCAAGILAVWNLPGADWAGTVRFTGAPAVDLSAVIQGRLMERSHMIKACQSKAPTAAGPVMIKMKVAPNGSMSNVEVSSSLGAAINSCVKTAVTALTLDALPTKTPVNYALAVAFAGKSAPSPSVPVENEERGQISGTLTSTQVGKVMTGHRDRLLACGKKGKAKGVVVARFTVRTDGTTKNVVIKEPIGDAAIEACLFGVYKSLTFPAAADETKVSYPITFR